MSFISRLFGGEKTAQEEYQKLLDEVNSFKDEVAALSDDQIRKEISDFKAQISKAETSQDAIKQLLEIRSRVFALTREGAKRAIGQFHYDVQVIGGLALTEGRIAEMKTGEGKTLTATLPLVLFALAGKGAHLVTVNDYLARWQASLMGPVFKFLGLTAASIQHEASFSYDPEYKPEAEELEKLEGETEGLVMDVKHMRPITRKEAYAADITYGTNNEYGFDYLRDNMVQHQQQMVQRELFFAIVDEVDSILIDEARTPLIISTPDTDPTDKYVQFSKIVEKIEEGEHYSVDEKHKAASLSDAGINKIEKLLNVPNIYDTSKGVTTIHHIEQALRAKTLFKKDRDYVVRDGEIIIVDEFTGRLMFGRRYSEGLHQAIEAKEGVKIQQESKTLATITFQNLFRLYVKLSGMTGTAKTEEEEFFKIYQLTVAQVPTHRPMVRVDQQDMVYKTEEAKFAAIATEVKARHKNNQPVLIGTVSIAKNELLADFLKKEGLPFEVLNAKNHEREAQIISQAGRPGQITLATNIAGRGVDILLGGNPVDQAEAKAVRESGGLHILGTERHESRRIDNQLRGRAGRQGDPGSSQFFVSMEDDLLRLFGGDKMKSMMDKLGLPDDQPIEASLVSRSIEQAQKKIEGLNFDTRKHVLEFDDVLNHQRNIIYKKRRKYLAGADNEAVDLKTEILGIVKEEIGALVVSAFNMPSEAGESDPVTEVFKSVQNIIPTTKELVEKVREESKNAADREFAITDALYKVAADYWDQKEQEMGKDIFEGGQRFVALQALDTLWMEHLDTMDHLRDSVRLRGYGQRDPLVEYKKDGYQLFQQLLAEVDRQIVYTVFHLNVQKQPQVSSPMNVVTNMNESASQSVSKSGESIGRNDPCPCGSGKKWKKCGMLNTKEHMDLMAKK